MLAGWEAETKHPSQAQDAGRGFHCLSLQVFLFNSDGKAEKRGMGIREQQNKWKQSLLHAFA